MDAFDPKKYHYRTCREGHCRKQSHATKAGKRATCEGGGHCVLLNVSVNGYQWISSVLMLAFFAKVAAVLLDQMIFLIFVAVLDCIIPTH